MNIYIGNLPVGATSDDLRKMFDQFGTVQDATVERDADTHRSKGYGFVSMPSALEAEQAIVSLNRRLIDGRTIQVDAAIQTDNASILYKV